MQLQDVKFKSYTKAKRVGRGGHRGKTSGKGMNGQRSRAGKRIRPAERDFIKKIPKIRGRGKNLFTSIQKKPQVIDLTHIKKHFKDGEEVNIATLTEKGVLINPKSVNPKVKILSNGDIDIKVSVSGVYASVEAIKKIEKAGGKIEVLEKKKNAKKAEKKAKKAEEDAKKREAKHAASQKEEAKKKEAKKAEPKKKKEVKLIDDKPKGKKAPAKGKKK